MNVGFFLGHPAHFHYIKNTARQLMDDGHKVFFAVKEKDILETLLKNAGYEYTKVRGERTKSDKWHLIKSVVEIDINLGRFVRDNKIDIIIGPVVPYTTRLLHHVPVILNGEDDARIVPLFSWLAMPMASCIVSPTTCDNWHWERKSAHFPGYLELGYLHPNNFTPSKAVLEKYGIDASKPYFIMRFSSLNAHHDAGIKGINTEIAERLISILENADVNESLRSMSRDKSLNESHALNDRKKPRIYITSERPLEPQFEKYRIKINPLDMHHVMAFASLYIGDSQTMAAEAGVLGVPFVRFNDFVGRIGYLRELEDIYELGYGIHATPLVESQELRAESHEMIRRADGSVQPSGVEELYKRVGQLVAMPSEERRATFQQRREKMLSDKIDCAKFLTWFIENYPQSAEQTRKADISFWERFK